MQRLRRCKTGRTSGQEGLSLLEATIVLGVVSLALAAVWMGSATVWSNYKLYRVNQQIMTVVKNVREAYGMSGKSISSITTSTAYSEGLLPADLSPNGGSTFFHALGGVFVLSAPSSTSFRLALQGLKKAECMKMLMEFPVLVPELALTQIGTATQLMTIDLLNMNTTSITASQASTWCSSATGNEVRLVFKTL